MCRPLLGDGVAWSQSSNVVGDLTSKRDQRLKPSGFGLERARSTLSAW
jgi:hypothetical protein